MQKNGDTAKSSQYRKTPGNIETAENTGKKMYDNKEGTGSFRRKKPELLCPAGSLEVLRVAVDYGADAVYIGGDAFGLRAKAHNFSPDEMAEGIRYAHEHGAAVHVTANILAHEKDMKMPRDISGNWRRSGRTPS